MEHAEHKQQATLKSYAIGFALSIALTLAAYGLVTERVLVGGTLVAALLGLAVAQLVVQMWFFLHIGEETGGRLKLATFLVTLMLVLIVVAGSIWIMGHLNYQMMSSPGAMQKYIEGQQAF
ncbi:MAG TPA: cytochrome o ubiquinol oxidase subunit IV [Candidatus Binatia bacterium]|jgi:cytochrome o ubiquinol oxidase operon protein cyoD|nr:cytochrome o ubiquinol oxidase subunit IV [Candidatus Binatia bacterium]